jgi:hypothetical protein
MEDNKDKMLSPKALRNLQRNEFLRGVELGLQPIPRLEQSTEAIFDLEMVEAVRADKEIDGKRVLAFNFRYFIYTNLDPVLPVREIVVDLNTSAKIDSCLAKGIKVFDVQVVPTREGLRYDITPIDDIEPDPYLYQIILPRENRCRPAAMTTNKKAKGSSSS